MPSIGWRPIMRGTSATAFDPSEWSATVTPTDFSCPRSRATRSSDKPSVVPCRSAPL